MSTPPSPPVKRAVPNRSLSKTLFRESAKWMRWLHIYLSMLSFSLMLFFAVTGLTLNHPDWFTSNAMSVRDSKGTLTKDWLGLPSEENETAPPKEVAKLEIVEHLRANDHVRGALGDFTIDDFQIVVGFKAPAYTADIFIDRETGEYEVSETSYGLVALMNDLHKGRDSGTAWSVVIDFSAILMVLISLTGFALIFYIKRQRAAGLFTSFIGLLAAGAFYCWLVPR